MYIRLSIISGILFLCSFSYAGNLAETILSAAENDPRVVSAKEGFNSVQTDADGTISVYLPTVSGSGAYGKIDSKNPSDDTGLKQIYGLSLKQPIPAFGKEFAQRAISGAKVELEKYSVVNKRNDVIYEIIKAILDINHNSSKLAISETKIENLTKSVALVKESIEGGTLKATDEISYFSMLNSEKVNYRKIKSETEVAVRKLKRLAPDFPDSMAAELRMEDLFSNIISYDSMKNDALNNSLSIRKIKSQYKVALEEYGLTKSQIWPDLSLSATFQRGDIGSQSVDSDIYMLNLDIPIFEGGARVSKIKSHYSRVQASKLDIASEENSVMDKISELWSMMIAYDETGNALKEQEKMTAENMRLVKEQLENNSATILVLLDSYTRLLDVRMQIEDNKAAYDGEWLSLMYLTSNGIFESGLQGARN